MRLQEFAFDVEYLPGPDNVVADHLSRHNDTDDLVAASLLLEFPHMAATGMSAVAGHLAFATAGKALDVLSHGGDILEPADWAKPTLAALWSRGDADSGACKHGYL